MDDFGISLNRPQEKGERLNRAYLVLGVTADLLIIALSLLAAFLIRFGLHSNAPLTSLTGTWVFYSLATLLLSDMETVYYARTSVNRSMHAFRMIRISLIVTLAYVLTVFLFRIPPAYFLHSRLVIALVLGIWAALSVLTRVLFMPHFVAWLVRLRLLKTPRIRILACGDQSVQASIRAALDTSPFYRILIETVPCEGSQCPTEPGDRLQRYLDHMAECRCDDLCIADDALDFDSISRFVITCHEKGIAVSIFSKLFEGIGYFDTWLSFADRPAVVFFTPPMSRSAERLWRTVDIVLGTVMLLALTPLLFLISLMVEFTSSGPVLFKQKRVGLGEKPFTFLKFRSMTSDVSGNVKAHKAYFEQYVKGVAADDDGTTFKKRDGARVTPIGRILRKASLDELPQLMSVVKGTMSLVGPRPCIPYEMQYYKDWQLYRFTVKPGLTGIWQVYGRSRLPFDAAQFLDLCYALKRSIGLNTRLLLKTMPVIMLGKGGY